MLSPYRLSALFALSRALQDARDPAAVAERLAEQASRLTGGSASIWTWDTARDVLIRHGEGDPGEREVEQAPERARVLRDGRPTRTRNSLVLPLLVDGRAIGVLEVEDAPAGDLASGGLQYWQSLADVVAAALDEATSFAELARAEARFRSLVEQIPVVTYLDRAGSGEPIYCSPQLETLFGIPAGEWLDGDDGWERRIHPDDRQVTVESWQESVRDGRPYFHEYRLISPDGTVHWVCDEAATVTDAAGNKVVQGVIYDVTDRKLAEQRFRDAESRYRTLVEQLPLAIYIDALDEAATSLYKDRKSVV